MKPVYMINGFLESGKTEFITYTLAQPYFQVRGTTLLILCEEGEIEYDPMLLKRSRTVLEVIEEEEDFVPNRLIELEKKHKPERIVIEYNGMWNYKEMKLPWHWKIEQQVTTINAATFPMYFTNMKSLLAEQIRKSELIIFNRCDGVKDLSSYKRNVKAINPAADIVFEDANGEVNEIMEEELPYDLKADVIELDNTGYGIWYLDAMDHMERYEDKTLSFLAMVLKPKQFPKGYFVPGRMAMTCCAEDMAFLGYACAYEGADALEDQQWVKVTATAEKRYFEGYQGEGPVLHALKVEQAKAPKEEVISFV
ncbi:MAG: GTPase [Lachnospiraceae bacterium]|nr:GTPase [Lachnospiraceae bacterium]MDE7176655.1 GTPase [Lachnospiraceae bacterium]